MFGFREVVQITLGPNLRLSAINISWIIWRKNRQYIFYLGLSWSKKGTLRVQSVTKVYWNALKLTKKLTKYLLLRYKNPAISCRFTSVSVSLSDTKDYLWKVYISSKPTRCGNEPSNLVYSLRGYLPYKPKFQILEKKEVDKKSWIFFWWGMEK